MKGRRILTYIDPKKISVNERGRLDPTFDESLKLRRKVTCNTLHFKYMYIINITKFINFKARK